jgi:hypothetical protein
MLISRIVRHLCVFMSLGGWISRPTRICASLSDAGTGALDRLTTNGPAIANRPQSMIISEYEREEKSSQGESQDPSRVSKKNLSPHPASKILPLIVSKAQETE